MNKLLVLTALALPLPVLAQGGEQAGSRDVSYTYAELRYVDTDGGGDGLQLNGSYALDENWLVVGELSSVDYGRNIDATTIGIGAGYVYNFDNNLDLVATLELINRDVDTPGGGGDDNGFSLAAGARGMVTDAVEVRGFVHHVNLDNNDTYLEVAGDYYFSRRFSAGASLEFAGDNDVFTLGVRLYFR